MRCLNLLLCIAAAAALAACGFAPPNQVALDQSLPEINVKGDFRHPFYAMVVDRLRMSGVKVNAQNSSFSPDQNSSLPLLMLPEPQLNEYTAAVDSKAQALEYSIIISSAATLRVPNHRPIIMRNSITRAALNKAGHALSSAREREVLAQETYAELASALVQRLGYLGRQSDPDARIYTPGELVYAKGEEQALPAAPQGLSLMEALQAQDAADKAAAPKVSLDQLNNGSKVLARPQLPKVKPELTHQAPASLSIEEDL